MTGRADLPLHGGKAPRWLFRRMVELSGAISEVVIREYGREEFLKRITDPYWFQSLACTIGFDWHSSGTTTTTCGALKLALDPSELGVAVLGGKGKTSLRTPQEIEALDDVFSLRTSQLEELTYASRMSAKVDNSCIQDDYQLYHHSFFVTEDGDWGVVQQGMCSDMHMARRYHLLSDSVKDFLREPHLGVCCDRMESEVLDMTAVKSEETRKTCVDLINDDPVHLRSFFSPGGQTNLDRYLEKSLTMPSHHQVLDFDVSQSGWKTLKMAYEFQPQDFEELISLKGVGPKKIRALALVSDLIYGTEPSWEDPVKYSFAHGGKDGTPFPVDRDVYDSTLKTMDEALNMADIGEKERISALRRLHELIYDR